MKVSTLTSLLACLASTPSLVQSEPGNGSVPQHAIDRFYAKNQVKAGKSLKMQVVNHGIKKVEVDGRDISIDNADLIPVQVFAKGAKVLVDGEEYLYTPVVFFSKQDPSVIITKNYEGELLSASKHIPSSNGRGKNINVLPVHNNHFFTVSEDDLDSSILDQFELGDDSVEVRRLLRSVQQQQQNKHRDLETTLFDVVTVDLVLDSNFCANYGGAANANAKAQSIVVEASTRHYEKFGVKLEIGVIQEYCSSSSDPIQGLINQLTDPTRDICGGSDPTYFLPRFKNWVAGQSELLNGDVVHLFHGHDFANTNVIGCAYRDVLCSSSGWNTGVNEMTFSGTLLSQANLFTHELAHNLAATHPTQTETGNIMSQICSTCGFTQGTIDTIELCIDNAPSGCIHQESTIPTPQPTPAPTPAPVTAPTPPPGCVDEENFYLYVNNDPDPVLGCPYVANSSWRDWICASYWWAPYYCPVTCNAC